MEGASEEENQTSNNGGSKAHNSNEGQSKPKRQMKTPFQLETLEKAYSSDAYPAESIRAVLSEKLGLSDRQLQMWFCHRRLKDKKDGGPAKKVRKAVPPPVMPESPVIKRAVAEPGSDYASGSGSGSSPFGPAELRNVVSRSVVEEVAVGRRYYEPPPPPRPSIMERAVAVVEGQLGEPLRDDGPILGIEFDPLPPDAFGAPIVPYVGAVAEHHKRPGSRFEPKSYERHDLKLNKASQRALQEYSFLPESSSTRNDTYGLVAPPSHLHNPALDGPASRIFHAGNEQIPRAHRVRVSTQHDKQGVDFSPPLEAKDHFTLVRESPQVSEHPIISAENPYMLSDGQVLEKKRKNEEARIAREVEAHELRVRKELEKQDILRRKHEERVRKEAERQGRERKKEEERLVREKQREEERSKREQKREMERREKFLQKANLREEKRKQKEELRRQKEAVRRKAAVEKATARRIARESMELIEDEQLELMEIAASQRGLHSIASLDHDTLQILESFRELLAAFPPKSVQLKRPFAIQPWNNSEENIGKLLMVWRFFITFADVLQLWPFTLDEFVQAFHDFDSRLLGEIHVALLKLIIKDVEDVARTPSSGLGLNQCGTANPGGGHPEIVEGAYTWGFDIRNWQRLLNPLTWPEVLRQLALSAGFGPHLKKRSLSWPHLLTNEEGKSCEDVISTLRSGSAASNAFSIMQEKGLLLPRKSRHRLTPGTVKFAAFHVLSLEGSTGLTVLELADKIQKSGLRDLTTSKTPEASISVALTRDAKLFERIAPSTYRVKAAYRKDPADAEDILLSARKKVQVFENGFLELAAEDADEVERDEDSECDDVDEDPEVDDTEVNACSGTGKETLSNDLALHITNEFDKIKDPLSVPLRSSKGADGPVSISEQFVSAVSTSRNPDEDNMEIDESKSGESWIHGLTEGEYSDLSVEERLNALVALIGIANEGNSIRIVLEDRLEAANSLKKQMWAEAQLDKNRFKEEITRSDFLSSAGGKAEMHFARLAGEGSQSPLPEIGNRITDMSPESKKPLRDLNSVQPDLNSLPMEITPVHPEVCTAPDSLATQQLAYASKRSRSQLKSYIAHRAEEMYIYRSLPLGQDRRRNRYWQFIASASKNDPGSGRIFVELQDGNWRLIDTEEAFDSLLTSLDTRGIRESHLRVMLLKIETSFKENVRIAQLPSASDRGLAIVKGEIAEMKCSSGFQAVFDSPASTICCANADVDSTETSSTFRIELSRNEAEKKNSLRRYQDFQKWMWKECFNSSTLRAMKYGEERGESDPVDVHVPFGSRLVKALLAVVEASVPPEALQSAWTRERRETWSMKLNASLSNEQLLQLLTCFESVIKTDFLASSFSPTEEVMGSTFKNQSSLDHSDSATVPVLPWVPHNCAAVAFRLFELDASVTYVPEEKPDPADDKAFDPYMMRIGPHGNDKEIEDFNDYMREESLSHLKGAHGHKRGRGAREPARVKKFQRKANGASKPAASARRNVNARVNFDAPPGFRRPGGEFNQAGGRGRRTVRKRRRTENMMVEETPLPVHMADSPSSPESREESPRNLEQEWEYNVPNTDTMRDEDDDEDNVVGEEEEEEDEEAEAAEYDDERVNWEVGYDLASDKWNGGLPSDDDDVDAYEDDENGIDEEAQNMDSEESNDEQPRRVENVDDEDSDSSASEEYSD